jgi:hypothetical protein
MVSVAHIQKRLKSLSCTQYEGGFWQNPRAMKLQIKPFRTGDYYSRSRFLLRHLIQRLHVPETGLSEIFHPRRVDVAASQGIFVDATSHLTSHVFGHDRAGVAIVEVSRSLSGI